jgi:hypothetical protein
MSIVSKLLKLFDLQEKKNIAKRRILFICKKRITDYGEMASSGLINSARMVAAELELQGHVCKLEDVIDGNDIDRVCHAFKPTHVILEAFWCPPDKLLELRSLYPKVTWTVRNHSKIPFLAGEGIAMQWAYAYQRGQPTNYMLSSNSVEGVSDFNKLRIPTKYTPNIYNTKIQCPPLLPERKTLHVGLFGAIRLLKNHMEQVVAALDAANRLGRVLVLHINVGRQEMQGSEPLKNIRAIFSEHGTTQKSHLVCHDWMSHNEFLGVITGMDIGLQVSYTETFNIVAADFVAMGVPVIGSPDISWLPKRGKADPNSAEDITHKMLRVLAEDRGRYQASAWAGIQHHNKLALKAWEEYLA